MIPEFGQIALIIAFLLSLCLSVIPMAGSFNGRLVWMTSARSLAVGLFVFVALSFGILSWSFYVDDFSVAYVANHSNLVLPVQYKISAVWGGHEGSLLLWVLILAGWTLAVSVFSNRLPIDILARVLSVMGMISVGFLLFMIATSNPFDRVLPNIPHDGGDLNPLLQDAGMIFHPPMLYMGYVGFSVVFAFAISALLSGRRCGLGKVVTPLDQRSLVFFDNWCCPRQLVGVLRTWVGRLVVLGPGRKCGVYAMVGGYSAYSQFGHDRKTGCV